MASAPGGLPPTGTLMPGGSLPTELAVQTISSMVAMATTSFGATAVSTVVPSSPGGPPPGPGMATMSAASIVSVATVFMFAATTAYLLRMLQPPSRKVEYIVGQVVITVAFFLLVTVFSLTIRIAAISVAGLDLIDLNRYAYLIDAVTNAQIVFTKLSFALSILSFSKLSKNVRYQRIVKGVVIFQAVYMLSVLPHNIMCLPLSDVWKVVKATDGMSTSTVATHCQNFVVSFYIFGTIELLNDVMLLLLPIPVIASLPGKHHRYGTVFLFALGICVLFADILKLIFIPYVGHTYHSSGRPHSSSRLVWSFVGNHMKSYISLIVACLPQVRVTLVQLFTSRKQQAINRAIAEESGSQSPKTGLEKYTYSTSMTVVDDSAERPCEMNPSNQSKFSQEPEAEEITVQLHHDSSSTNHLDSQTAPLASCLTGSRRYSELHKAFSDALRRRLSSVTLANLPVVADLEPVEVTTRGADWEHLYPPSAVQIKPFDDQFEVTRHSPEMTHLTDTSKRPVLTRPPSQDIVGRSTFQKEYFDLVVDQRKQSNNSQSFSVMEGDTLLADQSFEPSNDSTNRDRSMGQPIDSPTWGLEAPVFDDKDTH